MAFPVLRFTAGVIAGAAGLILIGFGAFLATQGDVVGGLSLITPGIAIIGPLTGFFVGEATGRRPGA